MKVLVTGGTGFVGSWLVRRLIAEGLSVKVLHRSSSDLSQLEGLNYEHCLGDITDLESLIDASRDVKTIFHLAGYVGYSKAQRQLMDQVNIGGTQNAITACIKNKVDRMVYMSSVVAIGASDNKEILNEDSPYTIKHLNLGYFETKRIAEEAVQRAIKEHNLDCVMLNPSTIYGPGDALKGSRKTQIKVARGEFPFYTSGGASIANIRDVVEAVSQAWKAGKSGERYILAGENLTIQELFTLIAEANNQKPPAIWLPNPIVKGLGLIGDTLEAFGKKGPLNSENAHTATLYHWFDSSKAIKELGYKVTSAKESIDQSVHWMKTSGLLD